MKISDAKMLITTAENIYVYKKIGLRLQVKIDTDNAESNAQAMADVTPENSTEKILSFLKTDSASLNMGKPITSVAATQGTEKAVNIPINTNDS